MRRGLGNPRRDTATTFVQNRAAELKQRFATYRTLLQTEGPTKFFEPLPSVKRDQIRKYAEKQRLNAPPEKAQAWHTWEMMQDKFVESQDYDYQKRFMTWLMGKGLEEDHKLTPWGREAHALLLPEVRAWIEQMIDAASITENYLAKLLFRGPQSLEEYAIYYKYLLHMEEYLTTDDAWIFIEFPELYNGYHLTRGPDAVMPGPPADKTDNFDLGKMGKEGQERILDIRETAAKLTQKFNDVALAAEYRAATAEERRRMEEGRERELLELLAAGMEIVDVDQDVQDAAVQLQIAADIKAHAASVEAKQAELRLLREERRRLEEEERRRDEEAAREKRQRKKGKAAAAAARDEQLLRVLQGMEEKLVRRAGPMEGVEPAPVPGDEMDVVIEQKPVDVALEEREREEAAAVEAFLENNDLVLEDEPQAAEEPVQGEAEEAFEFQGNEDFWVEGQEQPPVQPAVAPEPMVGVQTAEEMEQERHKEAAERLSEAKAVVAENVSPRAADFVGQDKNGKFPLVDAFIKLQVAMNGIPGIPDNFLRRTFIAIESMLIRQTKPKDADVYSKESLRDAMTVYFRRYAKRLDVVLRDKDQGKYTDAEGRPRVAALLQDLSTARSRAVEHIEHKPFVHGESVLERKRGAKTEETSGEKPAAKKKKTHLGGPTMTKEQIEVLEKRWRKRAQAEGKAKVAKQPASRSREGSDDSDYSPSTSSSGSSSKSKSPKKK